jgi:p-aminobenzoyl-glutamate transporter AbgT
MRDTSLSFRWQGIIFYAAGRHPLAGIAAAFAGVSGGFSANFIPCGIDPLLAGLTTTSAQLVDPGIYSSIHFATGTSRVHRLPDRTLGWLITDFVIEPKLRSSVVDGDPDNMPKLPELTSSRQSGNHLRRRVDCCLWRAAGVVGLDARFIPAGDASGRRKLGTLPPPDVAEDRRQRS